MLDLVVYFKNISVYFFEFKVCRTKWIEKIVEDTSSLICELIKWSIFYLF